MSVPIPPSYSSEPSDVRFIISKSVPNSSIGAHQLTLPGGTKCYVTSDAKDWKKRISEIEKKLGTGQFSSQVESILKDHNACVLYRDSDGEYSAGAASFSPAASTATQTSSAAGSVISSSKLQAASPDKAGLAAIYLHNEAAAIYTDYKKLLDGFHKNVEDGLFEDQFKHTKTQRDELLEKVRDFFAVSTKDLPADQIKNLEAIMKQLVFLDKADTKLLRFQFIHQILENKGTGVPYRHLIAFKKFIEEAQQDKHLLSMMNKCKFKGAAAPVKETLDLLEYFINKKKGATSVAQSIKQPITPSKRTVSPQPIVPSQPIVPPKQVVLPQPIVLPKQIVLPQPELKLEMELPNFLKLISNSDYISPQQLPKPDQSPPAARDVLLADLETPPRTQWLFGLFSTRMSTPSTDVTNALHAGILDGLSKLKKTRDPTAYQEPLKMLFYYQKYFPNELQQLKESAAFREVLKQFDIVLGLIKVSSEEGVCHLVNQYALLKNSKVDERLEYHKKILLDVAEYRASSIPIVKPPEGLSPSAIGSKDQQMHLLDFTFEHYIENIEDIPATDNLVNSLQRWKEFIDEKLYDLTTSSRVPGQKQLEYEAVQKKLGQLLEKIYEVHNLPSTATSGNSLPGADVEKEDVEKEDVEKEDVEKESAATVAPLAAAEPTAKVVAAEPKPLVTEAELKERISSIKAAFGNILYVLTKVLSHSFENEKINTFEKINIFEKTYFNQKGMLENLHNQIRQALENADKTEKDLLNRMSYTLERLLNKNLLVVKYSLICMLDFAKISTIQARQIIQFLQDPSNGGGLTMNSECIKLMNENSLVDVDTVIKDLQEIHGLSNKRL